MHSTFQYTQYITAANNPLIKIIKQSKQANSVKALLLSLFFVTSSHCFAQTTKVQRVIDGDTYVITSGEKVRMLGIDAPEMSTAFGEDAKSYLKNLIEGETVVLKEDNTNNNKDKYGRLLRYTYLKKQDINLRMVCEGFAIAYTKFKFTKKQTYTQCQQSAEINKLGFWANYQKEDLFGKQRKEKRTEAAKTEKKKLPQKPQSNQAETKNNTPVPLLILLALAVFGVIIVMIRLIKAIK